MTIHQRSKSRANGRIIWLVQFSLLSGITIVPICSYAERLVYTIDPDRSELVVQVFKEGLGATLAHDHVVRATVFKGRLEGDPNDLGSASIALEVQAASLRLDEPDVRQRYGLTTQLSDAQRLQIQATMESESQLSVAQFPVMRFHSTHVDTGHDGEYVITGALTIRGVTQPVTFPVLVDWHDGGVHGSGSLRFRQSSFGYLPYSALLGAIRTQDEVVMHFDVLAIAMP